MSDNSVTEQADIAGGMKRIGSVEILKARVYPLDAEAHNETRSTVVVEPGHYDLYRDGLSTFWLMRGKLNQRGVWRMGDGMFGLYEGDSPSDIEVVFPSQRFGPDEWADLLASSTCADGPEQRLRVSLDQAVQAMS
jgi:hypothetical protein